MRRLVVSINFLLMNGAIVPGQKGHVIPVQTRPARRMRSEFLGAIATFLFASMIATIANAESFLCVATKTTGFEPDKATGKWNAANFQTDQKFVIKSVANNDPHYKEYAAWGKLVNHLSPIDWLITEIGNPNIQGVCTTPDPDKNMGDIIVAKLGIVKCDGLFMDGFIFNVTALKFERVIYGGYAIGSTDSAALQIGECSRL
jgi:hypothetical protein